MKNTIKLFGIIALVAFIGFSMTACEVDPDDTNDTSGGGTFVLTDIPEAFNGKYAFFEAQNSDIYIRGCESYDNNTLKTGFVKITNGKASFSMFWSIPFTYGMEKYYGNDIFIIGTDPIRVAVFNNVTDPASSDVFQFDENFVDTSKNELIFKSGSATKSANDGYWVNF